MHCLTKKGEKSQQSLHLAKFIRKYKTRSSKTHLERKTLTILLSLIYTTHDSWSKRQQTLERFGSLEISRSSWMKGGVTVTNFRSCTCLVLMLLLLVSILIMGTITTYILCIGWKVSATYTKHCLENYAAKPIGHHVTSQWSPPTHERKEVLSVVLSPLISTPKWIFKFICHIVGHSKKNYLHCVGSSQQCWMYVILFVFVKFCGLNSNLYILFRCW